MLSLLEPKSEAAYFVQSGQTHKGVNKPTRNSCFTENSSNKVELEKTYQAPVKGTDKK